MMWFVTANVEKAFMASEMRENTVLRADVWPMCV